MHMYVYIMLEYFLITAKNKRKDRNHVFVCMEVITKQKRSNSLHLHIWLSVRCVYICMHDKYRENKKEISRERIEQSNSKGMNELQGESMCQKKTLFNVDRRTSTVFLWSITRKRTC
jgi:hypothetical protein